ncbi:MAG: leucine-rich repeat domain-containing protein, partial [bacterium]
SQKLFLESNQISDISPLANLTKLQELYLESNQISDISPLANLTKLQELDLSNNQISDIRPLTRNAGLGQGDEVYLDYNLLNLTPGSGDMNDIQILKDRGVTVYYR